LGSTITAQESSPWENVASYFSLTGLNGAVAQLQVTLTTPNNASQDVLQGSSLFIYGSTPCFTVASGLADPSFPDANTAVYDVPWLCFAPETLILAIFSRSGQFEFDILVTNSDNTTEYFPGVDAPLEVTFPHNALSETRRIFFDVGATAKSIIVEGVGDGNGAYQLQLYRGTDCVSDGRNCPANDNSCFVSVSRPADGAAGKWYVEVSSNLNGADTVTVTITLGNDNCVNVTLSGTNFCFGQGVSTTRLFATSDPEGAEFGPNLVYNAVDALPGASADCLSSLKTYLCNTAFAKCDADGWIQDVSTSCDQCNAFVDDCGSSEICTLDGICNGVCGGTNDGNDGNDGDGSAAASLYASMFQIL